MMAHLECVTGNLDRARALTDRGYELAQQARSDSLAADTLSIRAIVDAHAGRIEETRAGAAAAIELAGSERNPGRRLLGDDGACAARPLARRRRGGRGDA